MNWTLDQAPGYKPTAVATDSGWVDPDNNDEILVAIRQLADKAAGADVVSVAFGDTAYARTDAPTVVVSFNENVNVTAGATLVISSTTGLDYTATAAEQLDSNEITFTSTALRDEAPTISVAAQTITGTIVDAVSDAVKAVAIIALPTNPSAGDTVVVGDTTYTFRATVSTTANEVLIGSTAFASLQNLCRAINLINEGGGVFYGSLTVANASATATVTTTQTLRVEAITAGTAGNSVTCTTDVADGTITDVAGNTRTTLYNGTAAEATELAFTVTADGIDVE